MKICHPCLLLTCISSFWVSGASAKELGFEAIKPEISRVASKQVQIARDESVRFLDLPIKTEGSCRRIDLRQYQAENLTFMTDFEMAVSACADISAPTYWTQWQALEYAQSKPELVVYEMAVDLQLSHAGVDDPLDNVVTLAIARQIIENHKSGVSQSETTMRAFQLCIDYSNDFANWSSEQYPPDDPNRREQRRGQIVCGEGS